MCSQRPCLAVKRSFPQLLPPLLPKEIPSPTAKEAGRILRPSDKPPRLPTTVGTANSCLFGPRTWPLGWVRAPRARPRLLQTSQGPTLLRCWGSLTQGLPNPQARGRLAWNVHRVEYASVPAVMTLQVDNRTWTVLEWTSQGEAKPC